MASTEIAEVEAKEIQKLDATEPRSLIEMALEREVDVEVLERLVALEERVAERNARAAFFAALSNFQESCPEIPKSRKAEVDTQKGANFSYDYAPLEAITRTIRPLLREVGLSFSFDAEKDGGDLIVICVLRHIDGHEERARFPVPTESSAAMTAAQKNGAALTYGRRQSLVAVLGLTTADPDTDAVDPALLAPISEEQAIQVNEMIREYGVDKAKFLRWLGYESVPEIMLKDFDRAVRGLTQKRNAKGGS